MWDGFRKKDKTSLNNIYNEFKEKLVELGFSIPQGDHLTHIGKTYRKDDYDEVFGMKDQENNVEVYFVINKKVVQEYPNVNYQIVKLKHDFLNRPYFGVVEATLGEVVLEKL